MKVSLRKYGGSSFKPHKLIELHVESSSAFIAEDITNLSGHVSADLISCLRDIADELEEQNRLLTEQAITNESK